MRLILPLAFLMLLAGCAGFDGRGLVPGQSTENEVEALMGPSADQRKGPGGESVRYYSRLPYGRVMYAARFTPQGKLIAIEQRLTESNVARLRPGSTRADDVRELIGPPYRVDAYPRLERDVWTYKMYEGSFVPKDLYVQLSRDGIVREVMMTDDPQYSARDTHM